MSYILDAIKKAEQERDKIQMVDIKYHPAGLPRRWFFSLPTWLLIGTLLIVNLILLIALLSPKAPLAPPTVYFIAPLPQYTLIPQSEEPLSIPKNSLAIATTTEAVIQVNHSVTESKKLLSLSKAPLDF